MNRRMINTQEVCAICGGELDVFGNCLRCGYPRYCYQPYSEWEYTSQFFGVIPSYSRYNDLRTRSSTLSSKLNDKENTVKVRMIPKNKIIDLSKPVEKKSHITSKVITRPARLKNKGDDIDNDSDA